MLRSSALFLILHAFLPAVTSAQHPQGWQWRFDRPAQRTSAQAVSDSTWRFDEMAPGWHLTSGPAGMLYPDAPRAAGPFTIAADFVVFPGTSDAGFGLFIGGSELDGATANFLSVLMRRDGSMSVTRTTGGAETVVVPWKQHAVIQPHGGSGVVTNRMRVNASADSLRVFVNDSSVVRLALDGAPTDGHFGFRVGELVNLHLTILDYTRHLAPGRARE